jgi:hypothetical protein
MCCGRSWKCLNKASLADVPIWNDGKWLSHVHTFHTPLTMFIIDNILADDALLHQPFLCDLNKCKGACCTVKGGSGAPLLDSEIETVQDVVPIVWDYLAERSRAEIRLRGTVEGSAGEYGTTCIDDADCVFVYYEKGSDVAKCAIERAYNDGKTTFRKPLSCHLFPIRVADFNGVYLYYEEFSECQPALSNGKRKNVALFECVKDALTRAYGEEWYAKLEELARQGGTNKAKQK